MTYSSISNCSRSVGEIPSAAGSLSFGKLRFESLVEFYVGNPEILRLMLVEVEAVDMLVVRNSDPWVGSVCANGALLKRNKVSCNEPFPSSRLSLSVDVEGLTFDLVLDK
ncbi:hypothetical protein Droror1_Dr00028007 [Drosera rotundifolia]